MHLVLVRYFLCDAQRFAFIKQIIPGRWLSSYLSFIAFSSNHLWSQSHLSHRHHSYHQIRFICTSSRFSSSTVIKKSTRMSPVQDTVDSPVVPTQATVESVTVAVTKPEVTTSTQTSGSAKREEMEVDDENTQAQPKLYFVKLTEHASAPTKGSKLAAGYDLKSAYDAVVPKRGSCLVKTDIQIQLPSGTYGRVAPRSGLALKNKIDVGAGVIDEDYRGNIGVILFNHADEDFIVTKGDRIAQLICEKICYPEAVEVQSLEESERGAAGFGSTGGVKKLKLDEESEKTN